MDALELLTADHNRVRGLFKRCKQAKSAEDVQQTASLAAEIFEELHVHTTIEEEVFYPWAQGLSKEIRESVDEGLEEHRVAKTLIEEAKALPPGDDAWEAKLKVLIESVEHHAEEEETELFPSVRSATSSQERETVGTQLEAKKVKLGAPVLADKIDLTTDRLRELASAQEIPGRSKMGHEELAATVKPA